MQIKDMRDAGIYCITANKTRTVFEMVDGSLSYCRADMPTEEFLEMKCIQEDNKSD